MKPSKYRNKKTEHGEQCAVIDWCNVNAGKYPMLKWIYAIPNGAYLGSDKKRRGIQMSILKAEGFKAGVPDLHLPFPIRGWIGLKVDKEILFPGLYIEMKSKDTKGKLSKDQKEWIDYLKDVGYRVEVCWSADEAINVLEDYLK